MSTKGNTNNPGGRPKGIPNRSTTELRRILNDFLSSNMNLEQLQSDLDSLEPKDRLNFIDRMISRILPAPIHPVEHLTEEQVKEVARLLKEEME